MYKVLELLVYHFDMRAAQSFVLNFKNVQVSISSGDDSTYVFGKNFIATFHNSNSIRDIVYLPDHNVVDVEIYYFIWFLIINMNIYVLVGAFGRIFM